MFGVPPNPVSPSTAPVVIVDLPQESYSRAEVLRGWDRLLSGMACPACGQRGRQAHGLAASFARYPGAWVSASVMILLTALTAVAGVSGQLRRAVTASVTQDMRPNDDEQSG